MGTEFSLYDGGENQKKMKKKKKKTEEDDEARHEMAAVLYESNVLGSKGPRKMTVFIPTIDAEDNQYEWVPDDEKSAMISQYKSDNDEHMLKFRNKEPKWNETVQAYVLNFNGRVDQASVKNF